LTEDGFEQRAEVTLSLRALQQLRQVFFRCAKVARRGEVEPFGQDLRQVIAEQAGEIGAGGSGAARLRLRLGREGDRCLVAGLIAGPLR